MIAAQGINAYAPNVEADEGQAAEQARNLQSYMPFSIIGSTEDVTLPDGRRAKGREYSWGVAEGQSQLRFASPQSSRC